jgi:exopolysaccharide production protein ExoY
MNVLQYRQPLPNSTTSSSISVVIDRPIGGAWKRALDIVVAISALILLSPLFLLTALLVKFSDGGPVFYSHNRVGYGGKTFGCIKFRTMRVGVEKRFEEYLRLNPEAAAEWENTQKLRFDPRVTFFGHALRKSSIDELPQLINILRGEMSVVGPRPVVADELQRYGQHSFKYCAARPGLTGLWQVSGRNDTSYDERVELDVEYCTNWSFWSDLKIIMWTLPALCSREGSY